MLKYDLGEMRLPKGKTLGAQIDEKATEYTLRIFPIVENDVRYKELLSRLPSERVGLYFLYTIREQIYPFVRQGYVIQWYKFNNKKIKRKEKCVYIRRKGILPLLKKMWDIESVPLRIVGPFSWRIIYDDLLRRLFLNPIKGYAGRRLKKAVKSCRISKRKIVFKTPLQNATIACHYSEGIDSSRRSDLHWYAASGISPRQVLVYFDVVSCALYSGRPVPNRVIRQLEAQDIQWVCLQKGVVDAEREYLWNAPPVPGCRLLKKAFSAALEQWIITTANTLLREVHYWQSFYNWFNVKIHYITEEGCAKNIAQAIAFDTNNQGCGLLVGRERSELFLPVEYSLGFHPKHIFFVWNKRAPKYFSPNYDCIRQLVVTGYQQKIFQPFENRADKLRSIGADFVVTLFDSGHGPEVKESTRAMTEYYEVFLKWVLEDPCVGLIIKPKKPVFFNSLPVSVHNVFAEAQQTGRCLMIDDAWGRLPAEACQGADMAVGIASPTAVLEAVIAGCRGVFYDLSGLENYEFYRWGKDSLIFNNLEKMMQSLKQYKEQHTFQPVLGDWSGHKEELCAFGDGKGAQRMGIYMRWLLETLAQGKNQTEAIEQANAAYQDKWGKDKIIVMEKI